MAKKRKDEPEEIEAVEEIVEPVDEEIEIPTEEEDLIMAEEDDAGAVTTDLVTEDEIAGGDKGEGAFGDDFDMHGGAKDTHGHLGDDHDVHPAEDDVEAAVDDDGAALPPEDDGELAGVGPERPTPGTHWVAYALMALNIIAGGVFTYAFLQDQHKRQEYAYAIFRHDLAILGLPHESEENGPAASRATLPNQRIPADQVERVMIERGVKMPKEADKPGGAQDNVNPAGVDESLVTQIKPSSLTDEILKEHFGALHEGAGEVRTVEGEISRVKKLVAEDMKKAAEDAYALVQGGGAAKVATEVEKLLLSLAMDIYQAEKLDKHIKAEAPKNGKQLYVAAALRRMAFDFLLPLEMFRPGDPSFGFVENFGDLEKLPNEKVMQRILDRLDSTIAKEFDPNLQFGEGWKGQERETVEKRLSIAYALISLGHVRKPNSAELLYPKMMERIPLVVGQYDFASACRLMPARIKILNDRIREQLVMDREGIPVGKDQMANRFIQDYEIDLQSIRFLQHNIAKATLRLKDLNEAKDRYEKLLVERTRQRTEVMTKIAAARTATAKRMGELRLLQRELLEYQIELADSEANLAVLQKKIIQNLGQAGGGK